MNTTSPNSGFFQDDYKPPSSGSGDYLNLKEPGQYKIRILGNALMGYEAWTHDNKPVRQKEGSQWELKDYKGTPSHFLSFPIWNYDMERLQIFTTTKRGIINKLYELAKDEDWGDPKSYDVKLIRVGTTKDNTSYDVTPLPAKPLGADIEKAFKATKIDMESLFEGGNPLEYKGDKKETQPGFEDKKDDGVDESLPF